MEDYKTIHWKRFQFLLKLLRKYYIPGIKVGDIGLSPFSCMANSYINKGEFYSIIPSSDFTSEIVGCNDSLNFYIYDLLKNPNYKSSSDFNELFDLIIFSEVLEHLFADDTLLCNNLNRLLKPGGILILTVPNITSMWNRLRLLFGRNILGKKSEIIKGVYGGYGHFREYTFYEITDLLQKAGFDIVESMGFNGYGPKNPIGDLLIAFLNVLPKTFAFHIVIVARKGI